LVIAEEARVRLALQCVLFVPNGQPPHKPGRPISPAEDRVAMVQAAIAENPHFRLSRLDVDRSGPCYTVDMLAILRKEWGEEAELYFIVGMDSLRDLPTWRDPPRLLSLCTLVAVTRPGYVADLRALDEAVPGASRHVVLLEGPALDISATELQRRVREGLPIRYQVPEAVLDYISSRRLYASV
jgi:nicotinate-nucleotide adenylyltransferase